MKSNFRTFKDHKDITRPDLLVMKPETNDRRAPRSLLQGFELQRCKLSPEGLCVS